jgi:hypothetical protein
LHGKKIEDDHRTIWDRHTISRAVTKPAKNFRFKPEQVTHYTVFLGGGFTAVRTVFSDFVSEATWQKAAKGLLRMGRVKTT